MRRGILLQYTGTASGYAPATYVYGPETSIATQIAYARTTIATIVATPGSGYPTKIELWTENFPVKRWKAAPGQPSVPTTPSGTGSGPYSITTVKVEGESI